MKFSAVVTVFNKAQFVRETVLSALVNKPAEVIVVDDGSTDDGHERIADLPVRLIRQANRGPGIARNMGIAEVSSGWVALLDGDDLWCPNHLETLTDIIRQTDAQIVSSSFSRSLQAEDRSSTKAHTVEYFRDVLRHPILWSSSVAIRTDVARGNPFITSFPGEESELWARLALQHPIGFSAKVTTFYRQNTGGISDQLRVMPFSPGKEPELLIIDGALTNPVYADRHDDLRAYKAHLLNMRVKQAIYAADGRNAREFMALGGRSTVGKLAVLPDWLLRLGISTYRLAKRWRGKRT